MHEPQTASALADLVKTATSAGTKLSLSPTADADQIGLSKLAAVVEYPHDDMTVTVQAGMAVRRLREMLAEHGQQVAVDSLDDDQTIAKWILNDDAGPRRFGYGTLRDYLIGMEAVDGQGRVFHSGGRVVKNVAGYDLCRLLIGSQGRLAVPTELTFRLKPIPLASAIARFEFNSLDEFEAALTAWNTTSAMPVILDFESQNAQATAILGVTGSPESCQWQIEELARDANVSPPDGRATSDNPEFADHIDQFMTRRRSESTASPVLPSQLANELRQLGHTPVFGHAGTAVIFGSANKARTRNSPISEAIRHAFDPESVWQTDGR